MTNSNNNNISDNHSEHIVSNSLIEFLFTVARWKTFLIVFTFLCVTAGILYAVLSPKIYKATASVLPAEQSDLLSGLSGISSIAKSFSPFKGLGSLGGSDETDKYVAILKSSTVLGNVIETFNMRKAYDMEDAPMWKVAKKLSGNLEFNVEDEGNLTINVFDENPKLAADIANHLVDMLNSINTQLHVTNAKSIRDFVEKRYQENANEIIKLEGDMKAFQKKNGVIAVPEQLEATFTALSGLYGDLAEKEIEYNVLRKTLDENNPALKLKELEVQEFKDKLRKINADSEQDAKTLIPLNQAPELVGQYLNIFKNLEIQYKIAEFITPVYEQAKIEEIRNTPSVLVLDRAFPPDRKAKPKITLYALISLIIALIVGFFVVFTFELMKKLKTINPEKYHYITRSFIPFRRRRELQN